MFDVVFEYISIQSHVTHKELFLKVFIAGRFIRTVIYQHNICPKELLSGMTIESYSVKVCSAGYHRSGGPCVMCTGNTIKREAGDAQNCDTDVPCDGVITLPNAGHTACGKFVCSEFN